METTKQNKLKCEFCEQSFFENQLTKEFNRIYNHLCSKCKTYIEDRIDQSGVCSQYCIDSGKCDKTCY